MFHDLSRWCRRSVVSSWSSRATARTAIHVMRVVRQAALVATALTAIVVVLPTPAAAQVYNYPAMQLPRASVRDYTAAVAGGAGTTAVFQWREGWTTSRHLQLDVGLADRKGRENLLLLVGGSVAQELARAAGEQPLDVLLSAGAGAAFGSGTTLVRFPVGVSVGHTFEFEYDMALTPFVHPRASLDLCSSCGRSGTGSRSEVTLNFDVGVNYQVNRQFALRLAAAFTGSDMPGADDTFAIGFNWIPAPLTRQP